MSSQIRTGAAAPVAVIGVSCLFPGAQGPDSFWDLLRTGASAVGARPADRAEGAEGLAEGPDRGGYLDRVADFDARFFGISPREAAATDPQQRLVLELAWQALEDAGIVPATLRDSSTSVFVGSLRDDYTGLLYRHGTEAITQHTMTGTNRGVIANRVSYHLGLRGPSLTVDSAQSSSLVAVHLAAESLRSGESTTALVAGVNLNLLPENGVTEQRFGALSPDGNTYTFDARANGFVPGEGAGVLVLKPLAAALADGDRVRAVILGSAVNNDGATEGLTVPGPDAQERVIARAVEQAGVRPQDVQYVELHGTGTPVGDPIEAAALGAALGSSRDGGHPLRVGSVKTNIGHLEGAAGIAGLIKTLLSLEHRELPPSLNFASANPAIPLERLNLAVQTETTTWPAPDRPLVAGVSSFGMGGTNAHVVLGEAPAHTSAHTSAAEPGQHGPGHGEPVAPWVLSAKSPEALRGQAARLLDHLAEHPDAEPADIGYSLATTRTFFPHRAVLDSGDHEALAALAAGRIHPGTVTGRTAEGGLAYVFTGQGAQRQGMGQELYEASPVFAAAFDEVCAALDPHLERPLREVIASGEGLAETGYTQPALFAVEVALFRWLSARGLRPDVLAGHSIGEISAAHAAGVLDLADAARLVAARGRLMQALPRGGAMVAVEATEEEVAPLLAQYEDRAGLAAVNGPRAVVVSGAADAVEEIARECSRAGARTKRLTVSHAFHSPLMEPMLADLRAVAAELTWHEPTVAVVSSVTGRRVGEGEWSDPEYWVDQVRRPVRFLETVRTLEESGARTFLEPGPDGVCSALVRNGVLDPDAVVAVPLLRAGRPEVATAHTALATAFVRGARVDWSVPFTGTGAHRVSLPGYAFQRERYWLDGTREASRPLTTEKTASKTPERASEPLAAEGAEGAPWATGPESARRRAVADLVLRLTSEVLATTGTTDVDARESFRGLGFDSLMSVELRDALAQATGLRLGGGLLFDHPTPRALTDFLVSELLGGPDGSDSARPTAAADEPIAIVGMACRYPGAAASPEDLWKLVRDEVDAVGDFPLDRGWNPDDLPVRRGGFLYDADRFDAEFFGISPREAAAMDPQQRLLLETAWEAVESARVDPESLHGSRTGVFVGGTALDYGPRMHDGPEGSRGHLLTGGTSSVMSGRIAYRLGLVGPAVTVDTACSSSLVALHQAVRSLRQGETTLALAGGVTVMSTPGMFVEFARQGGLAGDGRCKPFAAAADGTGWSEGVGLLLLEKLSDAERNGHRVLAVVRGSAINQDGASNGLTAPNGPSQERVIRDALADAGLTATDIDAVEAHGTGTRLGDPIEAQALLATYGQNRPADRPLYLGSLKSNIGHAQAAAGVGGIIKMVQAMRHGTLPRTLHVDEPSPHVDWEAGAVELLTEERPWEQEGERPRRAAVSSFGISGTNAHVIIEEHGAGANLASERSAEQVSGPGLVSVHSGGRPLEHGTEAAPAPEPSEEQVPKPWLISAHSDAALRAQAARLRGHVTAHPALNPTDVGYSLATTRAAFDERAVVLADFTAGLDALAEGRETPGLVRGTALANARAAFLFTGQGSQRLSMGRELYESSPVFAAAFDQVVAALDPHLDAPLKDVLFSEDAALLNTTAYTQPALFALETALFRLLEHHGLTPDLLAGHSIGELSAAHVAGVLDLHDAATLVAARGRLMQAARNDGVMIAVQATEDEITPHLIEGQVSIAAINSPDSLVISGDADQTQKIAAHWAEQGRRTKQLTVSHAFHSPHMDEALEEFRAVAATLTFAPPHTPIVSTLTGELATPEQLTSPDYWTDQIRGAVRFHHALTTLQEQGVTTYLELGPDPVLTALAQQSLGGDSAAVSLLRTGMPETRTVTEALARVYVAGVPLDTASLYPSGAATVSLPTYAFQRERHWLASTGTGDLRGLGLDRTGHPFVGGSVELVDQDGTVFTGRLGLDSHPWLADHRVGGAVLLPATAFLELALTAGQRTGCGRVSDLVVAAPLVFPEPAGSGGFLVQVSVGAADTDGLRSLSVHARPEGADGPWTRHATGTLAPTDTLTAAVGEDSWPPDSAVPVDLADGYDRLAGLGFEYGPAFRGLRALWRDGDDLLAEVVLPEGQGDDLTPLFQLHPALTDAALHPVVLEGAAEDRLTLPFTWSDVELHATGATELRVRVSPGSGGVGAGEVSLSLTDPSGAPVATVGSLVLRPVAPEHLTAAASPHGPAPLVLGWPVVRTPEGTELSWSRIPVSPLPDAFPEGTGVAVLPRSSQAEGVRTAEEARAVVGRVLELVQHRLADDQDGTGRLVLVTRGAVGVEDGEAVDPAHSAVWGLLRSVQVEHPGLVSVIDVKAGGEGDLASDPLFAAALATGEEQLAIRDGRLHVPRLERMTAAEATASEAPLSETPPSEGTVLVTGGTGGLGSLFARHLVTEHGVRRLLLVSRSGPQAGGAEELRAKLTELGATVTISACDTTDRDQLAALLDRIPAEHPLTGVVHTAGVLDDTTVENLTGDRLDAVLRPKVDAAWHLHELTRGLDLRLFVLFSSVSGLLGTAGQANYAAGNTFLDALAQHRRAQGLPATSLAWGLWDDSHGMGAGLSPEAVARWERIGIAPLNPEQGLALFDQALALGRPLAVPARLIAAAPLPADEVRPVLGGLLRTAPRRAAGSGTGAGGKEQGSAWLRSIAGLAEEEREAAVLEFVRTTVASVLGHTGTGAVSAERAFGDLGFDSLSGVELRNRLAETTGVRLSPTTVFDHPTPRALAAHLTGEVARRADGATAAKAGASRVRARAAADTDEPIAIVGMACRYPGGVASPEDLWTLVHDGVDAVSGFPTNRGWDLEALYDPDPDRIGTSYTRHGGFLHEADQFDPAFFGLSPREATAMDPQQRLLLETAWETFENAELDPAALRGTDTGVFTGVMYDDYASRLPRVPEDFEGFLLAGNLSSVVSGRLSYTYGLEGPAVTVDTACSSSLVALHQAASALRRGECGLALAGGVTVMSGPNTFVEFSRQRGLSADGRCKSFAAAADGTGWSEGVGLLLLEKLSDAERNGHRVLAVVRGSAINQDGASNGLTAPNGPSQERVIRDALADAGLTATDIDAVEAHGTGTRLGDPIEAQALLATYGQNRPADRPLYLGSLKSNIGHAQAAAGVGGIIKMVQAMRHGTLPRTLHVDEPSPHVDWEAGAVELLTEERPWERESERPRRAAVSSFGISGTNAHVIIEEHGAGANLPAQAEPANAPVTALPWVLSAKSSEALRAQAARLHEHVAERPGLDPVDVGRSLVTTRAKLDHRAAVVGGDRAELLSSLRAFAEGENGTALTGTPGEGKTAFLFTGQGAQRSGMGRELYESSPVFAAAFDQVVDALDPHLDTPLKDVLFAEDAELLNTTAYTQPALFALETALFRLLEHHGLAPDLLAGHSIGELTAAHVSGVMDLHDAATLVATRGRLMQAARSDGAMIAVQATEDEITPNLIEGQVSIAAINAPNSLVISGDAQTAQDIAARWAEQGRRTKQLTVSHAFHSPHMDEALEEFRAVAATLTFAAPSIPIVSTLTGEPATTEQLTSPDYWTDQIRGAVRFHHALTTLHEQGTTTYLELGPDPVLTALTQQTLEEKATALPLLRTGVPEPHTFTTALAALHVNGTSPDWDTVFPDAVTVPLPTYAFQHDRYWLELGRSAPTDATSLGLQGTGHPLTGAVLTLADRNETVLTGRLSTATHPWLTDHRVAGTVLVPGTALVELAVQAADRVGYGLVEELMLSAPLVLPEQGSVDLQVVVAEADANDRRSVTVYSRAESTVGANGANGTDDADGGWTSHAVGALTVSAPPAATGDLVVWPPAGAAEVDLTGAYERLTDHGYEYGPVFQGLHRAWRDGGTLYAEIRSDEAVDAADFAVDPALLDAALHVLLPGVVDEDRPPVLPFSWSDVRVHNTGASVLRVRLEPVGSGSYALTVVDGTGGPVASVGSLDLRPFSADSLRQSTDPARGLLTEVTWTPFSESGAVADPVPTGPVVAGAEDLAALAGSEGPVPSVVVLSPSTAGSTGERSMAERARETARRTLTAVQTWLGAERFAESRLVLHTRGAVAVHEKEDTDPAQATVWGLVRSAQTENPGRLVLVDTDTDADSTGPDAGPQPDALAALLASGESQAALRGGQILLPRLARSTTPEPASEPGQPVDLARGTVLVTGGTGTLGRIAARHLITEHGVQRLLLVSRRGPDAPGAQELRAELSELGATVTITATDTTDRGQLAALLDTVPAEHPLTGIVHTAGVLDDGMVTALTPERLDGVLLPKVDAAWHLHDLTRNHDLAAFVLYSSIAGLLGTAGQANYAAGNTFLDALAHHRRVQGLPAASLAWGLWEENSGITGELSDTDRQRLRRGGLTPLGTEEAMAAFDTALALPQPVHGVTRLDTAAIRELGDQAAPLLRGLVPAAPRPAVRATAAEEGPSLAERLAGLDADHREQVLLDLVRGHIAGVLGHGDPDRIDAEQAFQEIGFDSLTAVELRNRITTATGLRLPTTLVFDHPTPRALTTYLVEVFAKETSALNPVLGSLDQLAAKIGAAATDEESREAISGRLRRLLELTAAPEAESGGGGGSQDLDAASDEELFALMDGLD